MNGWLLNVKYIWDRKIYTELFASENMFLFSIEEIENKGRYLPGGTSFEILHAIFFREPLYANNLFFGRDC